MEVRTSGGVIDNITSSKCLMWDPLDRYLLEYETAWLEVENAQYDEMGT